MRIFKMVFNGLLRWFFCHFQHFMLFLYFKNKNITNKHITNKYLCLIVDVLIEHEQSFK